MALQNQTADQIISFLKPKIVYNTQFNQYQFNGAWLIEITEKQFKEEVLLILKNVNENLRVGKNNKEFLRYLIELIESKFYSRENDLSSMLEFYDRFDSRIKIFDDSNAYPPPEEKYLTKDVISGSNSIVDAIISEDNYYYDIYQYSDKFNKYVEPMDVEKVKLNYALKMHNEWVNNLNHYIDSLLLEADNIKFSEFDFESYLREQGIMDMSALSRVERKCHINLSKIDCAHLFYFLMEENIFRCDINPDRNRVLLQRFLENNFTYDDEGVRKDIHNITKYFSRISNYKKEIHSPYIDGLINTLKERKQKL